MDIQCFLRHPDRLGNIVKAETYIAGSDYRALLRSLKYIQPSVALSPDIETKIRRAFQKIRFNLLSRPRRMELPNQGGCACGMRRCHGSSAEYFISSSVFR